MIAFRTGDDRNMIEEIFKLILGDPANYLSYYVGYIEILELKKGFEGSQMEFHKKLLEIGPAPFGILREQILYNKKGILSNPFSI